MIEIKSRSNPDKVLCRKIELRDFNRIRLDVSDELDLIQGSARVLSRGDKIAAHKHLPTSRTTEGTGEVWIVLQGSLKAVIFDLDDCPVKEVSLGTGESIFFYTGGHSLECLEEDTRFIEIKNGPYFGRLKDKIEI